MFGSWCVWFVSLCVVCGWLYYDLFVSVYFLSFLLFVVYCSFAVVFVACCLMIVVCDFVLVVPCVLFVVRAFVVYCCVSFIVCNVLRV